MSSSFLFSSNASLTTTKPTKSLISSSPNWHSTSQCLSFNRRDLTVPISVSSPSISYPQPEQPPFNVDYLQSEFGSRGVSFTELGSSYVVKMVLENGSAASLLLPSGLITSYKPKMWHGSTVEILHTSVSERRPTQGGEPIIQGGVSLALDCTDDDGYSWSPTTWVLNDITGSPQDCIQLQMISRDRQKMVEIIYNLTLKEDTLTSAISISNLKSSQLQLTGSILSHLNVSTPDATYAFGLEGSNFLSRPPLISDFCIIPPNLSKSKENGSSSLWPLPPFKDLFPANKDEREREIETEEQMEGEEIDNYMHLTAQMSKIYTSAPRKFTIIDRGKRNSVIVGRKGFEELYMYSPGSSHEHYGKYAYICVGQSAILKPIALAPEQLWRAEQQLQNPNI